MKDRALKILNDDHKTHLKINLKIPKDTCLLKAKIAEMYFEVMGYTKANCVTIIKQNANKSIVTILHTHLSD